MNILVIFGTTEGHTRKIATVVADHLTKLGHLVTLIDAERQPVEFDPSSFEAAVVAARVHAGGYQRSIISFVKRHLEKLNAVPCAFISVSMAAANHRSGDLERARRYVERIQRMTGWHPRHVCHAAGARLYAQHNWLGLLVLGLVDSHRDDATRDHEFTDWGKLRQFVTDWLAHAGE